MTARESVGFQLKPGRQRASLYSNQEKTVEPSLFIIPLVISVALVFCYGVARSFVQLWALHRGKEALLRRFDENPAAFESAQDVIEQISEQERRNQRAVRQDYTITGTGLALIGITALLVGRILAYGQIAVGLYIGGIACVGLGLLIALVGYLVHALSRPLVDPGDSPS